MFSSLVIAVRTVERREKEIKSYITLKFMAIFQRFLSWQVVQYRNQIVEVQLECHWVLELPRSSGGKWKLLAVATGNFCLFCSVLLCHLWLLDNFFNYIFSLSPWLFIYSSRNVREVYLHGRELFQSDAFLGTCTVPFVFHKLSAWGCSAGQEGGNFIACNSYQLLSSRLHALHAYISLKDIFLP